jgi:hypothetical protein
MVVVASVTRVCGGGFCGCGCCTSSVTTTCGGDGDGDGDGGGVASFDGNGNGMKYTCFQLKPWLDDDIQKQRSPKK